MLELDNYLLFLLSSFLLALAPGPDNIFVMTQGITKGKKEAIIVSCGLATGVLVHTTLAAFGVSVIFKTSELAFDILKYLGAGYLIYLAYLTFIHAKDPIDLSTGDEKSKKSLYIRGFFMNVLNPKVSLFFLAFLPSFTSPQNGSIGFQMIILGVSFMLITIVTFSSMGVIAHALGQKLLKSKRSLQIVNYITVIIFIILALKLVTSHQ